MRISLVQFLRMMLSLGALVGLSLGCQHPPTSTPTTAPSHTQTASLTVTPSPRIIPTSRPSITPDPSTAPSRTPGPSPTSTQQPGLTVHEWQPGPVLIALKIEGIDLSSPLGQSPDAVLYGSGQYIFRECDEQACHYATSLLPPNETCALFNTIDQLGFLDYDPASYQSPQQGGSRVSIAVNAWRSQSVALDQLDRWLSDPLWLERELECTGCITPPEISPALSGTYHLLTGFHPDGSEIYQPQKLAIWLETPWASGNPAPWDANLPPLSTLERQATCRESTQRQAVVLEGAAASQFVAYLSQVLAQGYPPIFIEEKLVRQVTTRWLLPGEAAPTCSDPHPAFPAVDFSLPTHTLRCEPADGFIAIPTLTRTPWPTRKPTQ